MDKKKYLLFTVLIIIGSIIGGIGASIFWGRFMFRNMQLAELKNVVELEELTYRVYRGGDINSSIIAFNYLVDKLESYKRTADPKRPNYSIFVSDLGLAHARLFVLYDRAEKYNLAEKEYQKAIELIEKVDSREELKQIIERIDKSARNSG